MTPDTSPDQEGHSNEMQAISQMEADYQWCLQQKDVLALHQGQVVVFHHRTFLGSGADHHEAMENVRRRAAEEGRPLPAHGLLFLAVPEPLPADLIPFPVLPSE
jgi:hypothetical protein